MADGWKRYISNADALSRYGFAEDKARPTAQAELGTLLCGRPVDDAGRG